MPVEWNRTKVVASIGPASCDPVVLRRMVRAGMDVARVNLSHGALDGHAAVIRRVRAISSSLRWPVAVMADLPGPKIRVGEVKPGTVLRAGRRFTLTFIRRIGDADGASVSYRGLPRDVRPGHALFIDDGLIRLEVDSVRGQDIRCRVVDGGPLSSRKGVNAPDTDLRIGALTPRDRAAIRWIGTQEIDYVALSFVRSARDLSLVRRLLARAGADDVAVVAKIEKAEAVDDLSAIVRAADGVMVARGDLGVELSPARVPFVQKRAIAEANEAGVPVITATQMLESMRENPRPTRAEVADVANAVLDGTDAVMLSGETAVGKHPVRCVETMASIVAEAERQADYGRWLSARREMADAGAGSGVGLAACTLARLVGARAIVTFTAGGATARAVSRFRPSAPVIGLTPDESTWRRLTLVWGVRPTLVAGRFTLLAEMTDAARKAVRSSGVGKRGDCFVLTAGLPFGVAAGTTNTIAVRVV